MFHVWHAFYQMLDEGEAALRKVAMFLDERFRHASALAKA
jgi:predicted transcriptional regulator